MANQTVYPYGTGGQTPTSIPIADDLNTKRADVALSAKQGAILGERTSSIDKTPGDDVDEKIEFQDNEGHYVGEINPNGAVFNSVKVKVGNEYVKIGPTSSRVRYLSDVIDNNDMFVQNGKVLTTSGLVDSSGNSVTSYVNIHGVSYIEYENLHAISGNIRPIFLYTEDFVALGAAEVVVDQTDANSGTLDLSAYPTANYAAFTNKSDNDVPLVKMFTDTEKEKDDRNNILVGAYYFAGWSETDFPNIHHTEALISTYKDRKPIWGWLDHGSFRGEGWLITPQIVLGNGSATLSVLNSCLFYEDGQCGIYIREVGCVWDDVTPTLPSLDDTDMTTTTVDISSYANKTVQVGFRLKNHAGEESAIWTINRITVTSGGSTVYDKNYTNHSNFDCEVTDDDVWKPATWTRGYNTLNGYVGTAVNQKDTSVIDKQIVLAKAQGIDYFMLEWFYYDDRSSFNEEASYNEDNHIAVHAFMKSCQKLGFKFALMITNHSPFRIVGLQNWLDAIEYLDREFFHDPSYLVIDNKPVVYVFDKTEYRNAGPANIDNYFISLGWSGHYMLNAQYNNVPNTGAKVEKDISILYDANKQWNITNYIGNHIYNCVTCLTCGWDSRPWAVRPAGYSRATDWYAPDISKWRAHFDWAYRFAKLYNNNHFRAMLICAWNEYGEGSYLSPTKTSSDMLHVIKETVDEHKF